MRSYFYGVNKKNEYVIEFSGLKEGHYVFNYEIGDKFFEQLEFSEFRKAKMIVKINFEKKETMMIANMNVDGFIEVMCDMCTDDFSIPVNGEDEIIFRFSEHEEYNEEVKCVLPNEVEIDFTHYIYEFICLLLPSRKVHPEGGCNQDMLEEVNNYLMIEQDDIEDIDTEESEDENEVDPRWAALKKLKKK